MSSVTCHYLIFPNSTIIVLFPKKGHQTRQHSLSGVRWVFLGRREQSLFTLNMWQWTEETILFSWWADYFSWVSRSLMVWWGYLQGHGRGVTYRKMSDSKAAFSYLVKPISPTVRQITNMTHSILGNASQQAAVVLPCFLMLLLLIWPPSFITIRCPRYRSVKCFYIYPDSGENEAETS